MYNCILKEHVHYRNKKLQHLMVLCFKNNKKSFPPTQLCFSLAASNLQCCYCADDGSTSERKNRKDKCSTEGRQRKASNTKLLLSLPFWLKKKLKKAFMGGGEGGRLKPHKQRSMNFFSCPSLEKLFISYKSCVNHC